MFITVCAASYFTLGTTITGFDNQSAIKSDAFDETEKSSPVTFHFFLLHMRRFQARFSKRIRCLCDSAFSVSNSTSNNGSRSSETRW
jgi:hypothetical protein